MKSIIYTLFTVIILLLTCKTSQAQPLSGTYLIGNYTGTDFTTFTAAANALKSKGISGPVVFNVANGTYKEQIEINAITGSSATNTITFQSLSNDSSKVIIQNINTYVSITDYTILLKNTENIIFKKITIQNNTGYYRLAFWGNVNNIKVLNCRFIGNSLSSLTTGSCIGHQGMSPDNNGNYKNIEINGNYFTGSPCFGVIRFYNKTDSFFKICNNVANNIPGIFVRMYSPADLTMYDVIINNNIFEGNSKLENNETGFISLVGLNKCEISNNYIKSTADSFKQFIFYIFYAFGNNDIFIKNNFVSSQGAQIAYFSGNPKSFNVCHNTFIQTSVHSISTFYAIKVYNSTTLKFMNNIVNSPNKIFNYSNTSLCTIDYNCYYNTNSKFAKTGSSDITFSQWQTNPGFDINSKFYNPTFKADNFHTEDSTLVFGTPISGITTDYDGDPRSTTKPWVGADEYYPNVLPKDTFACAGTKLKLSLSGVFTSVLWSTGSTSNSINLDTTGIGSNKDTVVTVKFKRFGNTYYDTVRVRFPQLFAYAGTDQYVCKGSAATITGSGGTYYDWNPPSIPDAKSFTITVNSNMRLYLTVKDKYGCSDKDTMDIFIYKLPVLTHKSDTAICSGNNTSFYPSKDTSMSYVWFYLPKKDTISKNRIFTSDSAGYYKVVATDTNGCVSSDSSKVTVNPLPPKPIISLNNSGKVCQGDSVKLSAPSSYAKYNWSNGKSSQQFYQKSSLKVNLIVTDNNNCNSPSSDTAIIVVNPLPPKPVLQKSGKTKFCDGDSMVVKAPAGYSTYNWNDGYKYESYTLKKAGKYYLTVTDSNSCTSSKSDTATVVVYPNPVKPYLSVIGVTDFCKGDSVVVKAKPGYPSYLWTDGSKLSDRSIFKSGTYSYRVIDSNGCVSPSSNDVVVKVNEPPTPVISLIGKDSLRCSESSSLFEWYRNNTLVIGINSQILKYAASGEYKVRIKIDNCWSDFSTPFEHINSSINNLDEGFLINVFPNPTSGIITIQSDQIEEFISVKVLDVCGREVYSKTLFDFKSINLNLDIQNGVYFLYLQTKNNNQYVKIVKE